MLQQIRQPKSSTFIHVISPATQEVGSQLPLTTDEEFKAAVSAAKRAFPSWRVYTQRYANEALARVVSIGISPNMTLHLMGDYRLVTM
ncbi:hypothetical protein K1719_017842 [Acacia pycnantha]|nr:hypothetical protein K1719_017842 [Acacia pycnantha]